MKFDPAVIMDSAGLLRAAGLSVAVLAAGGLINRKRYAAMKNVAGLLLMGSFALIFGLIIVCTWRDFALAWPILIYICGWLLTLKGILMVLAPQLFAATAHRYAEDGLRFAIKAALALGWGAALVALSYIYGGPKG